MHVRIMEVFRHKYFGCATNSTDPDIRRGSSSTGAVIVHADGMGRPHCVVVRAASETDVFGV